MSNEENTLNVGSNPTPSANYHSEEGKLGADDTKTTRKTRETDDGNIRFPTRLKHCGHTLATLYSKSKTCPAYRFESRVAGKRRMEYFPTYCEAKRRADSLAKELAQGSPVTALTGGQAGALTALEMLRGFQNDTGQSISLKKAVADYVEVSRGLKGHTLAEAVEGFMANIITVKRKDLAKAVEDFINADEPRTVNPPRFSHNP